MSIKAPGRYQLVARVVNGNHGQGASTDRARELARELARPGGRRATYKGPTAARPYPTVCVHVFQNAVLGG